MSGENVVVVARCRPFSQKERQDGHSIVTAIDLGNASIKVINPKNASDTKFYCFDAVFDADSTQVAAVVTKGTAI